MGINDHLGLHLHHPVLRAHVLWVIVGYHHSVAPGHIVIILLSWARNFAINKQNLCFSIQWAVFLPQQDILLFFSWEFWLFLSCLIPRENTSRFLYTLHTHSPLSFCILWELGGVVCLSEASPRAACCTLDAANLKAGQRHCWSHWIFRDITGIFWLLNQRISRLELSFHYPLSGISNR